MGEWHQRPRCRELPKGRTTFGSGCLGYFCLAELYEGLRKSQDRRGAGHAPALSYESAWEADRACLGIYSRGSVWASGFARNEPCLPGCVGGSEPEDCGVQVAGYDACILGYDPTYSTFGSSFCGFAGGSIESCAPPQAGSGFDMGFVMSEEVFGPMPVGGAMIGGDAGTAAMTPAPGNYDYCSYDPGYPSGDYDYCPDDPGYPSGDYDSCHDFGYPSGDYEFW